MGDNAHRADLLSGPARSPRTGLDHQTQREGIERPPGSAAAPGELMRLFVAIAPPPAVLDELDALVEPLRARRLDLRWTNREAWHVTLAFLGQVDEAAAARLVPRLQRAAGRHHQVRLAFAGAGAFPAATRANVLWSGLSGDRRALARLAESVTAGASRAGAPPPDKGRRFQPHLTLARCRMPADVTELVAALDDYQGQPWTADRVHLVRSRLGATEYPRYTSLANWPLRTPPALGQRWASYRAHHERAGHDDWLSFSRIGTAARSVARSSVVSSASRRASQASLRRRTRWTTARPSAVTVRITCRRSVGCGERTTRLRSSSTAMTRVIEGGCTFSCSASSPGVIAWCPSSADSAASWVSESTASVMPDAVRWARNRRASLLTEIRRAVASPASVLVCVAVIIGYLRRQASGVD